MGYASSGRKAKYITWFAHGKKPLRTQMRTLIYYVTAYSILAATEIGLPWHLLRLDVPSHAFPIKLGSPFRGTYLLPSYWRCIPLLQRIFYFMEEWFVQ